MAQVPAGEAKPLRYTRQPGTLACNVVTSLARKAKKSPQQILDFIISDWCDKNLDIVGSAMYDDLQGVVKNGHS